MFKKMAFALVASIGCGPAFADIEFGKTCKDLNDKVAAEVLDLKAKALSPEGMEEAYLGQLKFTVMDTVFDHLAGDLDDVSRMRIKPAFLEVLGRECWIDEAHIWQTEEQDLASLEAQQEAILLDDAIAKVFEKLALTPGKPRWGMVDLTQIDLTTVTCSGVFDTFAAVQAELEKAAAQDPNADIYKRRYMAAAPENDMLRLALAKYVEDLGTLNVVENLQAENLIKTYFLECRTSDNATRSLLDVLNDQARQLGLI